MLFPQNASVFQEGESTEYAGKCIVHLAAGKDHSHISLDDFESP